MAWIDGTEILSPIASNEKVTDILHIKNTSLLALLTNSSLILIHNQCLLPVAIHRRSVDSLLHYGNNIRIKTKTLNSNKISKFNIVNLFIITDQDFLFIYQVNIDPSKSLYELTDDNETTIQKLFPVNSSASKFSLINMFNQVTNSLGSNHINLYSIESFNDDTLNFNIEFVKLSIFKTIKIGIGILRFWLKSNSHNMFIYNENLIQIVNIKTLNNEIFNFIEFDWFDSKSKCLWYNYNSNYFICQDILNDLWFIKFGDNELNPVGHKVGANLNVKQLKFNPIYDLVLIEYYMDDTTRLGVFKFDDNLVKCVDIKLSWDQYTLNWLPDGEFFTVLNDKGHWSMSSKFGNITANTELLSNEINDDFLPANLLLCLNDSIILVNDDMIYKVNLTKLVNQQDLIITSSDYFSIVESVNGRNKLLKFPLLPYFKHMNDLGYKFKISKSINNQFIISFGDKLSISNPYKNCENDFNHLVWFNFKNYFMETLNIVNHLIFNRFLILINRTTTDTGSKDKPIDELIILNVENSKFAQSGEQFLFDSDLFIWRHKLDLILTFELVDNKLIILDKNYKLFVFELFDKYTNKDGKYYEFFMRLKQTIDFTTLKDKLTLNKIIKIRLIENFNFLILLNHGEFYILKNQSNKILLTNFYQLIPVQSCIEDFRINDININDELVKYIYLFKGSQLLIYNLTHLIDLIFEDNLDPQDGLEDDDNDHMRLIKPIIIELDNFKPLKIQKTEESINLIGLQDSIQNIKFTRIKLNSQLILNNLIEFDLMNSTEISNIQGKFSSFKQYSYCLELLLFDYLYHDNPLIHRLLEVIKLVTNHESIFINCLRKIEFKYWSNFFHILKTTPIDLMNELLKSDNVQLAYNFLIIYLNLKLEGDEKSGYLDSNDERIIIDLIEKLIEIKQWDWCFDLCRFIKLLDPSSKLLKTIKQTIEK